MKPLEPFSLNVIQKKVKIDIDLFNCRDLKPP